MQKMVQRLLALKSIPKPDDAADALAIALCHLNTSALAVGQRTGIRVKPRPSITMEELVAKVMSGRAVASETGKVRARTARSAS
jgi:hypothetical protein